MIASKQEEKGDWKKQAMEWKVKHDGMVNLYQNLRAEHLDLLERSTSTDGLLAEVEDLRRQCAFFEQNHLKDVKFESVTDEFGQVAETLRNLVSILEANQADSNLKDYSKRFAGLIAQLIEKASILQAQIAKTESAKKDPKSFYLKNSIWEKGLVSAAQAVGSATQTFAEAVAQVLDGEISADYVSAAAGAVSANVIQLVAASRVKAANDGGETLEELENIAMQIKASYKDMDEAVRTESTTIDSLTLNDEKSSRAQEMELSVAIMQREREIEQLRAKIGEIRRSKYSNNNPSSQ